MAGKVGLCALGVRVAGVVGADTGPGTGAVRGAATGCGPTCQAGGVTDAWGDGCADRCSPAGAGFGFCSRMLAQASALGRPMWEPPGENA